MSRTGFTSPGSATLTITVSGVPLIVSLTETTIKRFVDVTTGYQDLAGTLAGGHHLTWAKGDTFVGAGMINPQCTGDWRVPRSTELATNEQGFATTTACGIFDPAFSSTTGTELPDFTNDAYGTADPSALWFMADYVHNYYTFMYNPEVRVRCVR